MRFFYRWWYILSIYFHKFRPNWGKYSPRKIFGRWWLFTNWFRKSIVNSYIFFEILLVLAGTTGSVWLKVIDHEGHLFWYFFVGGGLALLTIILQLIWQRATAYQNPRKFAVNTIEGRPFEGAIKFIAYSIWQECNFVLKEGEELFGEFKSMKEGYLGQAGSDFKKKFGLAFEVKLQVFRRRAIKRYYRTERIDFMMVSLAKGLHVPAFRLSDALFQFNPHIFSRELFKVMGAMEEFHNMGDKNDDHPNALRKGLVKKIIDFREIMKKAREIQESMSRNQDLYGYLIEMTGWHGVSGAFNAYCRGLEQLGEEYIEALRKDAEKKNAAIRRFRFFYHKRRMFPGFDLHGLLINFSLLNYKAGEEESLKQVKKEMKEKGLEKVKSGSRHRSLLNLAFLRSELLMNPKWDVEFFVKEISFEVSQHNAESRKAIYEHFLEFIRGKAKLLKENRKDLPLKKHEVFRIVFITQGFSSVVNDVLFRLSQDFVKAGRYAEFEGIECHYCVLVSPTEMENEQLLNSRYIQFLFKANANLPRNTDEAFLLKVGDADWLNKSYDFEDKLTSGFMISGAEFIQMREVEGENYKESQLMNTEGLHDFEKLGIRQHKKLDHIVLADEYKLLPDFPMDLSVSKDNPNRREHQIFLRALHQDHLEHQHLYDWSPDRVIFAGSKKFFPKGYVEPLQEVSPAGGQEE